MKTSRWTKFTDTDFNLCHWVREKCLKMTLTQGVGV